MNSHRIISNKYLYIDLGFYKGPLNILYHILQKNEIAIREIAMKDIVFQLKEKARDTIDIELIEDSIDLINKLLVYKIESLIFESNEEKNAELEYDEDIADEYDNYFELQEAKKLTLHLKERFYNTQNVYFMEDFLYSDAYENIEETLKVSLSGIIKAYMDIFMSIDDFPLKQALTTIEVSISKIKETILKYLKNKTSLYLKRDLFNSLIDYSEKADQILTFWTVLSLEKENKIITCQSGNFRDIEIVKKRYGKKRDKK